SLKQRVTGIDLFERLIVYAAQRRRSVFFLGAREESVRGAVDHFARLHPALRIAGSRNGYFDTPDRGGFGEANCRSGAAMVVVAMGSPAQEYWIAVHLSNCGVRFAMGVGGSFDHVSGQQRRAPLWMQRAGFEWLHRLWREPRRLWRRYL